MDRRAGTDRSPRPPSAPADLAIVARDHADLETCEHELEILEGPGGTLWRYFRAIRLLETTPDKGGASIEANRLLSEIEAARPSWQQCNVLRSIQCDVLIV